MNSKFHSNLIRDLSFMLKHSDDRNVILHIGKDKNIKKFRAHSSILKARSSFFKNAFLDSERFIIKDNMIEFKIQSINPNVFGIILKYLYTGEVGLTEIPGADILGLLVASDELLLEELFQHLENYLIEERSTWIQENFVLVLNTVFKLAGCTELQDYCLESICVNPQPFITSKDFPLIDKNILYSLLKRDDLRIKEVDVWDYLIKWGIEQTSGLGSKNSDRTKWNEDNFKALKETLSQFIPLIRFLEISSSDFFDKIRPYKAVIPHNIYEGAMEFYYKGTLPTTTSLPPRVKKSFIESKIIKPNLASIIINWIENKHQNVNRDKNDSLYKFNLLYRGSRDGIDSDVFKNKCHRQFPCLILANVHHSPKIFGGYSPTGVYFCTGSAWHYTSESFIFSFDYSRDIENMKISRVQNHRYALYEFYNCAFNFGGGALTMDNDKNLHVNNSNYYRPNLNVNASYAVKEIEAFRVVRQ